LLSCVGTGRLAPIRGGALAADSRATRNHVDSPASGASKRRLRVIGWQWCPSSIDPAWFASRGSRRIGVVVSQASFGTTVRDACFASPWIGLATNPIDRTRVLLRTRAPVGDTPFDAFARWPSARCCRWESFHHEIHRPLTSPVACRHPRATPFAESSSHAWLSPARPTYAADLATDDSSNECLRTRWKLRPPRLSATLPEKTCMARAALTPPQWRDGAASTRDTFHRIDWLPAFACNPKCRVFRFE